MVIQRGELWWANLPVPIGSGPGYRRPVVVIQSDRFNQSAIQTVVVALISKNLSLAKAPGNVSLSARTSRLPLESVVNVSQLITIDRALLTEYISALPEKKVRAVEDGVRLVLDL